MLVDMVTMAELGETLSGEGPFTVFAPTNEAFAKVAIHFKLTNFTARDQLNFDKYKWSIISYEVRKGARCG